MGDCPKVLGENVFEREKGETVLRFVQKYNCPKILEKLHRGR